MPLLQQIYCKENNTCFSIPLEKRKVIKKTLPTIIFFLFLYFSFGLGFIGAFLLPVLIILFLKNIAAAVASLVALFLVGLVPFILIYILECYYYRYYFYDLREDEVVIKKGVISKAEITLPYSKIQNVFIDQDVLDRIFGLYDVHLETAGFGSGMAAHIYGVNQANSEKLRDFIMEKVKMQSGDRGV